MSDYRALYRKWRPVDFDDVSGQDATTDILKYEVANGKLSHAYLFSGSRGTGKTSCAKILAKAVNCTSPRNGNPCCACEACRSIDAGVATDVIEMDAASNNGVDNVRDMKDEIAFTPALLKYRVYIIDEVHMMSQSAFNALLKTLEEPPQYVIFILATTELHKLPTTIVSRCQRFDFKRISSDNIISRLKKISEAEGIDITDDAARVIARVARGGMRDAVSLLELCAGVGRTVDEALVFETVGSGSRDTVYKLIRAVLARDYSAVYGAVADVVMSSGDISVFWQELIDAYRDIMVVKNTPAAKEYLDLTELEYEALSELSRSFTPSLLAYHTSILEGAIADMQRAYNSKRSIAEIALTRLIDARSTVTQESLALRIEELERELALLKLGGVTPTSAEQTVPAKEVPLPQVVKTREEPVPKAKEEAMKPREAEVRAFDAWGDVVRRIGELKCSLSVQFKGSYATRVGDGEFTVFMNAFFAGSLASNERDLSIVRGVIAERVGLPKESVSVTVEPITGGQSGSPQDDLLSALGTN